jgi:hypothetical protein
MGKRGIDLMMYFIFMLLPLDIAILLKASHGLAIFHLHLFLSMEAEHSVYLCMNLAVFC